MNTIPAANGIRSMLTVEDVSPLLQLAPKTVRKLARTKALPAQNIGGRWRFRQADVVRFVEGGRR